MSNLVASQIMNYADISSRANAIEKWVAVADICRCLHNYNGVLEITAALNRSAIYRLKKTWAKVSKQVSISFGLSYSCLSCGQPLTGAGDIAPGRSWSPVLGGTICPNHYLSTTTQVLEQALWPFLDQGSMRVIASFKNFKKI